MDFRLTDLQSDFAGIKKLLDSDRDVRVEFETEESNYQEGGDDQPTNNNSENGDDFEKNFLDIFNRAKEYLKRVWDQDGKMTGGQKKELPPKMRLMLDISAKLREKIKGKDEYSTVKQKDLMRIAKKIVNVAEKEVGTDDFDRVRRKSLDIAERPDKYIRDYMAEAAEEEKSGNKTSERETNKNKKSTNLQKGGNNDVIDNISTEVLEEDIYLDLDGGRFTNIPSEPSTDVFSDIMGDTREGVMGKTRGSGKYYFY